MNRWWGKVSDEQFWLESTDRDDLGKDLNAPLLDDGGKDNWRYTLLREVRPGDRVLHYHKNRQAIVAESEVAGVAFEDEVVWGARGTYAREKGTEPHPRPGLRVPLTGFKELSPALALSTVREAASQLSAAKQRLEAKFGAPLYLPFELSPKRPARLLQGYIFKLPAEYLDILRIGRPAIDGKKLPEEVGRGRFPEGATVRVTVNAYERNDAARAACLQHWGTACVVCDFDFGARYGELGGGYIHVHHLIPLSTIGQEYSVDPVNDLRPVCPNCHAMLHRADPPIGIDHLKSRLARV